MNDRMEVLDSLARVLTYPGGGYLDEVARCRRLCETRTWSADEVRTGVTDRLNMFAPAVEGLEAGELEELYTRTFDINPVSSLEVGWHLYGETYERGSFLVSMRDLLRRCNIEESNELPDHLTHVMNAVGRMEEAEAVAFISKNLLRALDTMLKGFDGKDNPYEHVLGAVKLLLMDIRTQIATQEVPAP